MSIDREMDKEYMVHYTIEYHSGIKRNKIMPFAETCMNLETIISSDVSQTEKDNYHMIELICGN